MELLVELTEFGLGGRMERRIWTGLKRQLESKGNDRPSVSSQAAFLGGVKHQKELPAAPTSTGWQARLIPAHPIW